MHIIFTSCCAAHLYIFELIYFQNNYSGTAPPEPVKSKSPSAVPEEDDFADFQTASSPAQQQVPHGGEQNVI